MDICIDIFAQVVSAIKAISDMDKIYEEGV